MQVGHRLEKHEPLRTDESFQKYGINAPIGTHIDRFAQWCHEVGEKSEFEFPDGNPWNFGKQLHRCFEKRRRQ